MTNNAPKVTGDWQYHNDYTMATAATDDPRVFAVIERDECPEMPYSDLEPPVYALDYRWGWTVDYVDGDELADVVLVCHLGAEVLYTIDLLGPTPQRSTPTQIPLTPLSDPIIRSARMAARDRLGREGRSNA